MSTTDGPSLLPMSEALLKHQAISRLQAIQDGLDYCQEILPPAKAHLSRHPKAGMWCGFASHLARPDRLGTQLVSRAKGTRVVRNRKSRPAPHLQLARSKAGTDGLYKFANLGGATNRSSLQGCVPDRGARQMLHPFGGPHVAEGTLRPHPRISSFIHLFIRRQGNGNCVAGKSGQICGGHMMRLNTHAYSLS
jgi:hypothetical protein